MASFIKRIFRSPSPAKSPGAAAAQQEAVRKKSKSQGDLRFVSNSQVYLVREKDLQHKLHAAAWKGDLGKVAELCRPDKINVTDKEGRFENESLLLFIIPFLNRFIFKTS
jgi:hypothetical protein